MLPSSHAAKPFSCISCGSSFKRSGDLASHLTQAAKCHWVLKKHKQIQAAEIPDYREASDQESDPPAESDPFFPYEDMDVLAEDIFDEENPNEGQSSQSATNPITNGQARGVTVEDMPDEDDPDFYNDPDFYDTDARYRMEDELDSEVVYYKEFPNAGKVYRTDGEAHCAYSKTGQHADNPFHPFASQLDWEIARWANEDGPGQGAFTRLLNIDGVSLPILSGMDLVFMSRYR
jgi:hypothetical protein